MKKKILGRGEKQIMKKQKKKDFTTVNTTKMMQTEKIDFGTMRKTLDLGIWKSILNCNSQQNDQRPERGVKMENAEELKNQQSNPTWT
jgi:hypothetical protein